MLKTVILFLPMWKPGAWMVGVSCVWNLNLRAFSAPSVVFFFPFTSPRENPPLFMLLQSAVLNSPNGFPLVTLTLFWISTSYPKLNLISLFSRHCFMRLACFHTHCSTSYSHLQMTVLVYSRLVFPKLLEAWELLGTWKNKIKNVRG